MPRVPHKIGNPIAVILQWALILFGLFMALGGIANGNGVMMILAAVLIGGGASVKTSKKFKGGAGIYK